MAEYVAFWTTCLTGQGHFKAKARILQGVSKQQKAGFLRLDFSSILKRSFFKIILFFIYNLYIYL